MKNEFENKRILVTGGSGSIGSHIVKNLLQHNPKQIRIFSRDETKQFDLMQKLGDPSGVNLLIGDIRDKDRLNMAMEGIDIVFHAAALKHVLSCEKNPFEAVKTNVHGTQNIIDCALANNIEKVIAISTDKATDPTNVMGCTKLLSEKIMLSSYHYRGKKRTKFSCVRFGNVLWSRGSVLTVWLNQIKKGDLVTVTDENMTRFFMPLRFTVDLVFNAVQHMCDREIFILKMPTVYIKDMAQAMINVYASDFGHKPEDIKIKIIGKKAGERIHEKLLSEEESEYAWDMGSMFIITPVIGTTQEDRSKFSKYYPNAQKITQQSFSTVDQPKLSLRDIEDMLKKEKIIGINL